MFHYSTTCASSYTFIGYSTIIFYCHWWSNILFLFKNMSRFRSLRIISLPHFLASMFQGLDKLYLSFVNSKCPQPLLCHLYGTWYISSLSCSKFFSYQSHIFITYLFRLIYLRCATYQAPWNILNVFFTWVICIRSKPFYFKPCAVYFGHEYTLCVWVCCIPPCEYIKISPI